MSAHQQGDQSKKKSERLPDLLAESRKELADLLAMSMTPEQRAEVVRALERKRRRIFRVIHGGKTAVLVFAAGMVGIRTALGEHAVSIPATGGVAAVLAAGAPGVPSVIWQDPSPHPQPQSQAPIPTASERWSTPPLTPSPVEDPQTRDRGVVPFPTSVSPTRRPMPSRASKTRVPQLSTIT